MINQAVWASFTMVKQSAFLFGKMIKYSSQYPTPIGIILILTGLYFIVMYLELSAAAFVEWLIQWFWPTTRLILRTSERILKKVAGFLSEMDVLGQSTYCDMADLWCTEFGLMCHRKCSFLDMALDRSRF
uniref:ABC transmembrane type-1 domain-containing protein n=1 Tax=Panagrellus redivivus TaxID=6233 RepID=A0A7E4V6V4_PANRE